MTGGGSAARSSSQQQLHADELSVDEWWSTTFLRLSLRAWFWIGIGLFITFVLTVITIEVLKAYNVGPFKETTAQTSDTANYLSPSGHFSREFRAHCGNQIQCFL